MSIKNDIEMVKEELTSEEKFFEKSVITERFVKKYKNVIIGSVVVIVAIVTMNMVYDMNNESRIVSANEKLSELNVNPLDGGALAQLKVLSSDLHDLFIYSKAVADKDIKTLEALKSSKAVLIDDLATYESLQNTKNVSQLNNYALKQNSIYKDLANVESAIMLINEGRVEEAHEKLLLISDASSLDKVAKALLHYGVK